MSQEFNSRSICQEALSFFFKPVLLSTILNEGIGKYPIEKKWIEKYSTITPENLLKEATKRLNDNVGILCGKYSNIIVIDVDIQDNGVQNWTKICSDNNMNDIESFNTPIVKSGSLGYHYYFKYSTIFDNTKSKLINGVDILSTGKQVVYPGSIYPGCCPLGENKIHKCGSYDFNDCIFRGNTYEWLKSPEDIEISDVPSWLIKYIIKEKSELNKKDSSSEHIIYENKLSNIDSRAQDLIKEEKDNYDELDLLQNCLIKLKNKADNYNEWRDCIWCIRGLGFDKNIAHSFSKLSNKYESESVDKIWYEYDNRVSWNWGTIRNWLKDSLNENEYKDFCKQHFNKVEDEFRLYEGDYGLALIFSELFKDKLIISEEDGTGYLFNQEKKLYKEYGSTYLSNLISPTLLPIINKYINITLNKINESTKEGHNNTENIYKSKYKELLSVKKYILSSKGCKQIFIKVIYNLLNTDFIKLLDNDNFHLPIKKGKIINLKNATIRDRNNNDYFTFECPVNYIPKNENRNIVFNYIKSICVNDIQYTNFMIKFLGYLLTREISDRCLYILWGKGMNGKSKLLELIEIILGKLFTSCSADVLLKNERKGGATPELIPLINARVAVLNETDENEKLNSERIKKLTGDDLITARALFKNEITFRPKTKLLLITNKKPIFDVCDKAMTDRIKLLPFLASFQNTIDNRNYIEDIKTKFIDDFFSLLIDGCVSWWEDKNLILPPIASLATKEYFEENDTVSQWIKECCETGVGEQYKEQPSILFEKYNEWCIINSCKRESKQKFGDIISLKFGDKKYITINKKRVWIYEGIKLL